MFGSFVVSITHKEHGKQYKKMGRTPLHNLRDDEEYRNRDGYGSSEEREGDLLGHLHENSSTQTKLGKREEANAMESGYWMGEDEQRQSDS